MDQNPFPNLVRQPEHSFRLFLSPGVEPGAARIAARCARAQRFLGDLFEDQVDMTVLVLSPDDWADYALFPLYGWPHYRDEKVIVTAGEHNGYWRQVAPFALTLPPDKDAIFRATYSQPDGTVDLCPFFDFFPVHEMAHLFHHQAGFDFPREWLMELFCNLSMHTYLATEEPDRLTALTTFPQLIVDLGHARYDHHTLADHDRLYENIDPENYGWYQCQFLVAARRIYDAGGQEVLQRLWRTCRRQREPLTDPQLAALLRDEVHPEAAEVMTSWPL